MKKLMIIAVVMFVGAGQTIGGVTYWTDWTAATAGGPGSASGVITLSDTSTVNISYSGEITFAQTSGGINYWNPSTSYVSATVSNAPSSSDIITLTGSIPPLTNTITFSEAVVNPVMSIVSQGRNQLPVDYYFDSPFDVLSDGGGYWGGGSLTELSGDLLRGYEGHGTIQFLGTFTSIRWTCPTPEYWHGFTVGMLEPVPIPAPGAFMLGSMGVSIVGWLKRRRSL